MNTEELLTGSAMGVAGWLMRNDRDTSMRNALINALHRIDTLEVTVNKLDVMIDPSDSINNVPKQTATSSEPKFTVGEVESWLFSCGFDRHDGVIDFLNDPEDGLAAVTVRRRK